LPDFPWYNIPKTGKNVAKRGKIYQMAIIDTKWPENWPNGHKMYQHPTLLGPPKFTQIGIFGLKRNHLATPILTDASECVIIYSGGQTLAAAWRSLVVFFLRRSEIPFPVCRFLL
jgi:hypothetical protein